MENSCISTLNIYLINYYNGHMCYIAMIRLSYILDKLNIIFSFIAISGKYTELLLIKRNV